MTTEGQDEHGVDAVDWESARTFTGGDESLLEELVALFPGESAKHLEDIHGAIERADATTLTRAAHTLKTSARLFGASTLIALALEMEKLGQAADVAQAKVLLPELQAETRRVIVALQAGGSR